MLEKKWNLFSLLSTTAATLKIKCEFRCTGEEGDDEGAQASSFWQSAVRMTNDQHQRKVTNPLGWVESSLSNAALMVVPMDTQVPIEIWRPVDVTTFWLGLGWPRSFIQNSDSTKTSANMEHVVCISTQTIFICSKYIHTYLHATL